ncbi:hypothetical protein [Phenylobacterium sp.]|uniref:hypothetical protein n=1 Tax=Phenylobacterium sp. TaxID=1871053 RepID=UPI00120C1E78|nr:hypothetical protein [Phenylobacterium sp.]THD58410.1 MAG: hypothetical protein E8A49_19575 [Phenylobacterium sp.]
MNLWRKSKPTPLRLQVVCTDEFASDIVASIQARDAADVAVTSQVETLDPNVQGFDPVTLFAVTLAVYSAVFRPVGDILKDAFKARRGQTIEIKTNRVRRQYHFPSGATDADIDAAIDLLTTELDGRSDVQRRP